MLTENRLLDDRLLQRLRGFSLASATVAIVAGLLVLTGWGFNLALLKSLLPGLASMQPLTAVSFILLGAALGLLAPTDARRRRWAWLCGALVTLLGGLLLLGYLLNLQLGFDQWLFPAAVRAEGGLNPGRPAPGTTLCLLLLGLTVLNFNSRSSRWALPLLLPCLLIGLVALVGYLYGVSALYQLGPYTTMALHTALLTVLLPLGLLATQAHRPPVALLVSLRAGGELARRLLPAAVVLPLVVGWLSLQGQALGLYGTEFGLALFATSNVVGFVTLIYLSARQLNHTDARRDAGRVALQETSQQLLWTLQASHGGAWAWDLVSGVAQWSPEMYALWGVAPGARMETENSAALVDERDRDHFNASITACLTTHTDADYEFRIHHAALGVRWMETFARATYDAAGLPIRLVGLTLDITPRKQAEEALQQLNADLEQRVAARTAELAANTAKLRALFDVLPVGVSILDQDRRVVEMNPALERILDISPAGIAAGAYAARRYVHADGRPMQAREFASIRAIEEQRPVLDVETGVMTEDGRLLWTSVSAAPLAVAGLSVVVATSDVTVRKQTEAALLRERDLMQALMDNIPDTIYFKDTASRFTRINRAQCHVLGLADPDAAVGKTDLDFMSPDLAPDFHAEERRLFASGQAIVNRVEYNPTADGQPRWFTATKVPLLDAHTGQVTGLVGISRDITQHKIAEAALETANSKLQHWVAELEQRNREISLLSQLSSLLQACNSLGEAYEVVARLGQLLYPSAAGALAVLTPSRTLAEVVSAWGDPPLSPQPFAPDDCWALRRGRVHVVERLAAAPNGASLELFCQHIDHGQPAVTVCIPLMAQGEALGVLLLQAEDVSHGAALLGSASGQQLAQTLADQVALALGNLKLKDSLRQQSVRDPLTGLFNRRFLDEWLERELLRAARGQYAIGVIMIDLDHFKKFNDTFGHEAGDLVLKELAAFLQRTMRGGDIICRLGGEEFVVLLPKASLAITQQRAEQLLAGVRLMRAEYQGTRLGPLTVSLGVAAYPDHAETVETLLRVADTALYHAKRGGRDQVAVAPATPAPGATSNTTPSV